MESRLHNGEETAHLSEEEYGIIRHLDLRPHPEATSDQGCQGWYRETHRSELTIDGKRSVSTVIYYMLAKGGHSFWHSVDSEEMWLWHAGSALELSVAAASGKEAPLPTIRLGPDILRGERPQCIIPKGAWQAAEAKEGWALVSCVVAPAFEFSGFTLAEKGWNPGS